MEITELNAIDDITDRISRTLSGTVTREQIEHTVRDIWTELREHAIFSAFLAVLTERIARDRLRA